MCTAGLVWFRTLSEDEDATEEEYFSHRLMFTVTGLGIVIAGALVLNAFVFHRSMVYLVLAIIHVSHYQVAGGIQSLFRLLWVL